MIALVLKILITKCLKNHCYKTGNKTFQQMKDGLIGPDIQRALCQNYVMRWNDKFIKLCKEVTKNSENIDAVPNLLHTYVDDTKVVTKELPVGAEFIENEKKLVINKDKIDEDQKTPGDKRTMERISLREITCCVQTDKK